MAPRILTPEEKHTPAGNRTQTPGSGDLCDIHFTTGARVVKYHIQEIGAMFFLLLFYRMAIADEAMNIGSEESAPRNYMRSVVREQRALLVSSWNGYGGRA